MLAIKLGRRWWKDDPLTKQRTRSEKLFVPFLILAFMLLIVAAVVLTTQTNGTLPEMNFPTGPPTLDQILWMGLGSDPGKMTAWSAIGTVAVALITAKILSDTVKYYDHHGLTNQPGVAAFVAVGTALALAHVLMTCAQTWQLSQHAFTAYHSVLRFDVLCSTVEDMIAGFFNFSAAIYYTTQVFRLSGRKVWLAALVMFINTGVLSITIVVAVTGFRVPEPTMETMDKFIQFNKFRIPIFMAWGITALIGDSAICISLLYYLFKSKDSILHRGKTLYHKFKALVVGTMFPPVICIFLLVITLNKKTAMIGDYRRAIRYLLTPLYYLSILHSIVAKIDIRRHLAESQDKDTKHDSIPLTATEPGEMSTIHIDPKRGKDVVTIEARSRDGMDEVEEIPCKRTFGATGSISIDPPTERRLVFADQDRIKTLPKPSKFDTANFTKIEELPQKGTFGTNEPLPEITPIYIAPKTRPHAGRSYGSGSGFGSGSETAETVIRSPGSPGHPFHPTPNSDIGSQMGRKDWQVRGHDGGGGSVRETQFPAWADPYYFGSPSPKSPSSGSGK